MPISPHFNRSCVISFSFSIPALTDLLGLRARLDQLAIPVQLAVARPAILDHLVQLVRRKIGVDHDDLILG
jgi:hypothetical protein